MGISTTILAKNNLLQPKQVFAILESQGLITKENDSWALTNKGSELGAVVSNGRYGQYIAWPDDFDLSQFSNNESKESADDNLLNSTAIGKHFGFSANKVNSILSELGWIKKGVKGWIATDQGLKHGAVNNKSYQSGVPFTKWPESILESPILKSTVSSFLGNSEDTNPEEKQVDDIGFREKFEAKHRTTDGHYVRSKAEMLIDNFLYMMEIPHAYERRLPIEEEVYSDFYIPTGKVYIEYWGYENEPRYLARKKAKQEIYAKYGFNLIELTEKEVQNLDDHLPRLLLDFGIQTY
ncbi:hypothetical protein THMIRHAM_20580 [Thiomicrorhabdus immobilis]|uniref:Glycerol kinase n=1 Tax=Thiomicrorhabdus immobilis TaxID=2791037 RepID=A0ABN6CYX8_9GAMM|nr:hypothetical protein [Thiomicrorhabdus immobilis]BCN94273.1 hypothetical protein THMIRHAM_20580 [Thiomicrorhabdus immobilis]